MDFGILGLGFRDLGFRDLGFRDLGSRFRVRDIGIMEKKVETTI